MVARRVVSGVGLALALLGAVPGRALAQADASARPPWQARFDVAAGIAWFNGRADAGYERWYSDAAWFGVEGGVFLTEHVKLELGASAAGEGFSWSDQTPVNLEGQPISYVSSQHAHRVRSFSAGVTYQFRSNAWVHPYLGGGVDVDRDLVRTSSWVQPVHDPRQPFQQPYQLPDVETAETVLRPFGVGGVKVFFSQRVFFRADVKAAGSTALDKVVVRALVGADF